jgi:hypothetical protein
VLFVGSERLFRSGYLGNFVTSWSPALDGIHAKLIGFDCHELRSRPRAVLRAVLAGGAWPALGAQAGEARPRQIVVDEGGFTRSRRATETPFNIVLEARM